MAQDLRSVVRQYDRTQEEELAQTYATQKNLAYINLVNYPFVANVLFIIPEQVARDYQIIAFLKQNDAVRVATPDPFNPKLAEIMNTLGKEQGLTFEPTVCSVSSINYALSRYAIFTKATASQDRANNLAQLQTFNQKFASLQNLKAAISQVSTTELFDTLVAGAVAMESSDIHLEPQQGGTEIRFRIDGKLLPIMTIPEKSFNYLLARIKTEAHIKLDIVSSAGDGRLTVTVNGQSLDVRVNVIPSAYGQTVVMRLLMAQKFLTLEQMGFPSATAQAIIEAIQRPQGLIIFTGPTGSGKSTSLYAVLQRLNTPERKIITIEDPIEYKIPGLEQVQLDAARGFDFAQALRAILRQDPNVIMVGEIRDKETAEIAVNAALTGHLVLTTLHTNSAAASFARLLQMGVPKYLLADAITLVIAQRLVRKICDNCGGKGCELCHMTGFRGRILIAEHYIPNPHTAELIKQEATVGEFDRQFAEAGGVTLLQDGQAKVAEGLTTEQEVRSETA